MFDAADQFINESFEAQTIRPNDMDLLLSKGWRHFGGYFFRYNLGIHGFEIRRVIPLRIDLGSFSFTRSQRRNLIRNSGLLVQNTLLSITTASVELFERHRFRFAENIPATINEFIPDKADQSPTQTRQISVFENDKLIAESYFDVSETGVSGIYAIFDPDLKKRGLGIFTLLKEIEFAIAAGKKYYYLGYVYEGSSFYDYKKRFLSTEAFDWNENWSAFIA